MAFVQRTCCRAVEKMGASSLGTSSGTCWRPHDLFCLRSGILQRLLCTSSEIEPAIFAWDLLLIFKMIIHFAAAQAICILLAQQNIFIDFLQLHNRLLHLADYFLKNINIIGQHHNIVINDPGLLLLLI